MTDESKIHTESIDDLGSRLDEIQDKLRELFNEFNNAAVESWQERKRLIEKKYKNEGEKEREIQADTYYRAWSQMSNSIRSKFPELWTEFNK